MSTKSKKKINLLLIVDQIYGVTGGSEQHISFLLKYLSRNNYNIHFALLRDTGYYDPEHLPIKPIFLHFTSFYYPYDILLSTRRLARLIKELEIDIIHSFFPDSELLGLISRSISRSSVLVAVRRNMGYQYNSIRLRKTRFTNQLIAHFVVNCTAIKEQIIRLERIHRDKIEVIYNPIIRARIDDGLGEGLTRAVFGIKNGVPLVGIVANLRPVKDYETFLRAVRLILDERSDAKFIMVGSGSPDYLNKIDSLICDLNLGSAVINAGESQNPVSLMKLFDVGVLTSTSEGLSNTLIEYGAVGLPTVATHVGGNSEVVVDGQTGFLVPPSSPELLASRILNLIENVDARRQFGANARRFVERKFDQDSIINDYDRFYSSILDNKR